MDINSKNIENFKVGQEVLFSGKIYTARDQAHKKLAFNITIGKKLPIILKGKA